MEAMIYEQNMPPQYRKTMKGLMNKPNNDFNNLNYI